MRRRESVKYLFLWPALFTLLAVIIFPLLFTVRLSFSDWNIVNPSLEWVGGQNWGAALGDLRFRNSLSRLGVMVAAAVTLEFWLGMALAYLLTKDLRGRRFFRVLFLVPMMLTPVIMAVLWRTLFHETLGPLNDILNTLGLSGLPWLSDNRLALVSIVLVDVWQWTSFTFILLLAGMLSLPHEPYEAALIDGASSWQTFWRITFPMLFPISAGVIMIRLIHASKLMETIMVLTSGGPGVATETTSYYIYIKGLREFRLGEAASMSLIYLILMILALTVIARVLSRVAAGAR